MARVALLLNPVSGKGRAARAAGDVQTAFVAAGYTTELLTTEAPGDARRLARRAADEGYDALVTLGGDGTLSEAVDGILMAGPWPEQMTLTPLPLGRGNSFVRHFGPKTGDWHSALNGLLEGRRQWLDAALVEPAGAPARYMVNVFGTGFMAHAARAANHYFKALAGQSYTAGVLWQVARLGAPRTRITLEGPAPLQLDEPNTLLAICNTQWTGEEMWMAPTADPADGLLDVLALGALSRVELLRLFPKIFTGTHVGHPAVASYRAASITIEPAAPSPLLVDGEVLGQTPVTVRCVPRAIQVSA